MKKYILIFLLLYLVVGKLFSDTVEFKSGKVYSDVLTIVEPNSVIIYKENGQTEEIPKSELKKISLKIVSWRNNESLETPKTQENPYTADNKKEATVNKPKNVIINRYMGFYIQASSVNWQVSGMENMTGMQSSRLINGVFFRKTGLAFLNQPILRTNDDTVKAKGKAIDIGYDFWNNTNYPGKVQLRHIRSDSANFNSLNLWEYSDTMLVFLTGEIEAYKYKSNQRSILTYEQRYFFNPISNTLYYSRFGVQGGINAQKDSIKGTVSSIGAGSGITNLGTLDRRSTVPFPAKTSYLENSYFLHLGLVYMLNTFRNQELELAVNIYKGISTGNVNYNSVSVYPLPGGTKKTFSSNLDGIGYNLAYIFKLTEVWNLKLSFENRVLTYGLKTINTTNFGVGLGQDLGPLSTYKDKLTMLGIAVEYKF